MAGSKVKIWKQDPTVQPIGIRTAYIHTPVDNGPADPMMRIVGVPETRHDANGDFLFDPSENPKEFDAVHTFTVVRQVVTMYMRALRRTGVAQDFSWQWGDSPAIEVNPRAGLDANAFYSREERSLRFFYFHPHNNEALPLVYACRSFDIVAHETGHAILDALRPGYWTSWHPQTGGLHESFGDLTAILTMLAQMDQCEAIIAESKADLHAKTFFPAVAEQFGEALYGRRMGLRNADNDLKLSDVSTEVHDISQVFTGAVYDILADMFVDYVKYDEYDPAETLFRLGKHMTSLVIISLVQGPAQNATYRDIAQKMIEVEPEEPWKAFIAQRFEEREVLGAQAGITAVAEPEVQPSYGGCCGTLTHPDYASATEHARQEACRHPHEGRSARRTTSNPEPSRRVARRARGR